MDDKRKLYLRTKWIKEAIAFLERYKEGCEACYERYPNDSNGNNIDAARLGIKELKEIKEGL